MTGAAAPDEKQMRLRYPGKCHLCGATLAAGTLAVYERTARRVRCIDCNASAANAVILLEENVAGTSARREYDRRKASRERRVRAKYPKLGGLILALTDEPQSTRAWHQGAIGEELLAQRLKDLPEPVRILNDRRIRGTNANIDHIIILPSGVWVADAKRYKGKRPTLHVEGGLLRHRVESLRVGGRDGTRLVDGVKNQVVQVAATLDDCEIPVRGILCFLEAQWPLIGGGFTVEGVDIVWPRLLVERVAAAPDAGVDVAAVALKLAMAFPAA